MSRHVMQVAYKQLVANEREVIDGIVGCRYYLFPIRLLGMAQIDLYDSVLGRFPVCLYDQEVTRKCHFKVRIQPYDQRPEFAISGKVLDEDFITSPAFADIG